jgi:GH24 family phage-related lysozyme (muramidase)
METPNILLMRRLLPTLLGFLVLLGFASVAHGSAPIKGPDGFRTSGFTVKFIGDFEGFYPRPYNDPVGHCTIGYGHLIHLGNCTRRDRRKWGRLTEAEARRLLRKNLKSYEGAIFDRIGKAPISPLMMTALTSFTFNLGAGYLDRKPRSKRYGLKATNVAANIRRGNYLRAANQMRQYDGAISGGSRIVLPGLTRRRKSERRLMIRGIEDLKACTSKCGTIPDDTSGGINR